MYSVKLYLKYILMAIFCLVSSLFLSLYLLHAIFPLATASVSIFLFYILKKYNFRLIELFESSFLLKLFALLFTASLVLGYHIHISDNAYGGTYLENYIEPYSYVDLIAFVFIFVLINIFLGFLLGFLRNLSRDKTVPIFNRKEISLAYLIGGFVAIFTFWIPYFLAYWPGFVYVDTSSSLLQINNDIPLNNHHPVAFTFALKICIKAASFFHLGQSYGLALFTLIQMFFLAFVFSYLTNWLFSFFNFKNLGLKIFGYFLGFAFFGINPYVATFAISLWKDPVFTGCFIIISLYLIDLAIGFGGTVSYRRKLILFSCSLLLMLFRNNGVYVILGSLIALYLFSPKGKKQYCIAICLSLASYAIITGPVFSYIGVVPTEKAETVGIPLNQMARVVALDGDMSGSDARYMDSLLLNKSYKDVYRPCCTDLLKWDDSFNGNILNDSFWSHWISMFTKNPRSYFEAWELQTCGFWTVNVPAVNNYNYNITAGNPINLSSDLQLQYNVDTRNLIDTDFLPLTSLSISGGLLLWSILLCMSLLITFCGIKSVFPLFPSLLLILSLLVASPIWWWPRYVAPCQFLFPVFFVYTIFEIRYSSAHSSGDA